MIRLSDLKKKRKGNEENCPNKRFHSSAYLRITKDINDLHLPDFCSVDFPDPNDIYHFKVVLVPDEGFYQGMQIIFDFNLAENYPYDPPKVKCITEIYHPNIDLDGNVCLNILREDWRPVLSINSVLYGLNHLLLEPNPDDPLNETAAYELRYYPIDFSKNVKKVAHGVISAKSLYSNTYADDFHQS